MPVDRAQEFITKLFFSSDMGSLDVQALTQMLAGSCKVPGQKMALGIWGP